MEVATEKFTHHPATIRTRRPSTSSILPMDKHDIVEYVVDEFDQKYGVLLTRTTTDNGEPLDTIGIGIAICNIEMEPFDKIKGLHIANGRALAWNNRKTRVSRHISSKHRQTVKAFINRCAKYYKDKELPAWTQEFIDSEI